jgi:hypothetical protein
VAVRILKRLACLTADAKRILKWKLPFPIQPVAEALTLHIGHGEPELASGFPRIEDGQYVGVLEAGSGADLALEAFRPQAGGKLRMQHLQGDRPVVFDIVCEIYRGHAPAPELALKHVAVA